MKKQCSTCRVYRSAVEYSPHPTTRDRLQPRCNECRRKAAKEKYAVDGQHRQASIDRAKSAYKKGARGAYWASARGKEVRARVNAKRRADPVYKRVELVWYKLKAKNRVVSWVKMKDTLPFYDLARRVSIATGADWEVDHIIPLKGLLVSGLHVPGNLQVILRTENTGKGNSFDGVGLRTGLVPVVNSSTL